MNKHLTLSGHKIFPMLRFIGLASWSCECDVFFVCTNQPTAQNK